MSADAGEFIFSLNIPFFDKALRAFHFQYLYNDIYKRYVDGINCKPERIKKLEDIPFLPISFFKTHQIKTTEFEPEVVFKSSGTTGLVNSRHLVKEPAIYETSFINGFESVYGSIKDYCVLGLLPSYLERQGSSLIYMVRRMIELSGDPLNGFHLHDFDELAAKLKQLEAAGQKTLLIGVTYALLDFAASHPIPLRSTVVMETGGMKGRKKELLRMEVHAVLKEAFQLSSIHSEYGMTELLSQAYATCEGNFKTPAWMKVLGREEDDPLNTFNPINKIQTSALNIIDLANLYSCSFIATDDLARFYPDGSFEVLGRMDNSDIRGCSLLTI